MLIIARRRPPRAALPQPPPLAASGCGTRQARLLGGASRLSCRRPRGSASISSGRSSAGIQAHPRYRTHGRVVDQNGDPIADVAESVATSKSPAATRSSCSSPAWSRRAQGTYRFPADTPEFCALGIPLGPQTLVATQGLRSEPRRQSSRSSPAVADWQCAMSTGRRHERKSLQPCGQRFASRGGDPLRHLLAFGPLTCATSEPDLWEPSSWPWRSMPHYRAQRLRACARLPGLGRRLAADYAPRGADDERRRPGGREHLSRPRLPHRSVRILCELAEDRVELSTPMKAAKAKNKTSRQAAATLCGQLLSISWFLLRGRSAVT